MELNFFLNWIILGVKRLPKWNVCTAKSLAVTSTEIDLDIKSGGLGYFSNCFQTSNHLSTHHPPLALFSNNIVFYFHNSNSF